MKNQNCRSRKCCEETEKNAWPGPGKLSFGTMLLGLLSLLWLILRTGQKPSRIQYPCQRTALANVMISLVPLAAFIGLILHKGRYPYQMNKGIKKLLISGLLLGVMAGISAYGLHAYRINEFEGSSQDIKPHGVFGKKALIGAAAGAIGFLTVPHALALPSAHRVVSIRDNDASSWTFSCTSSGPCAYYYGEDAFIDQTVVDQMVERGLIELTGEDSIVDAWQAILPEYQAGQTVAIKVNLNDSIAGGGNIGYEDNDAYVDALPQVVNSIASGLISIGVLRQDIWIFDASRYIPDRFRSQIDFAGMRFFDAYGNGDDVEAVHYTSQDPSASIDFSNSTYQGEHQIADLLVYADYLINIPIMKRHGGTGITLSLKNHMGSIDGFYTGIHDMHRYIELGGSDYQTDSNPLVDLNLNANILNKTVLIVGDAIYGAWSDNNTPPERWASFGNDSPNMLLFSGDPVAIDSVMLDYLDRETDIDPESADILAVAANAGLGVHERWSNDLERDYAAIDFVEIDLSSQDGGGSSGSSSGGSSGSSSGGSSGEDSSGGSSGGCFIFTCY